LKRLDQDLFEQGLPHFMEILELDRLPELMFPNDHSSRRGHLGRELLGRIIADDFDTMPRAAGDAMRGIGKQVGEMLRDYLGLQVDRFKR
jgi:hypothetical protein